MTIMHRRMRLTLLIVTAVIAALILAAVLSLHLLLQPQRFTDMLRSQAHQAGLELTLNAPAEPTLWPRPALVLHGLTLSSDNRPVLVAARGRLVLPWRTLLGGTTAITRLELDAPRLNLAQLGPALADMHHEKSTSPSLPRIDAGVRINHGSIVRGNDLLLDNLHLETGPLSPGHIFSLQLTGRSARGIPVKMTLLMTPHQQPDAIALDNIHITASSGEHFESILDGQALWRGGANVDLTLRGNFTRSRDRHYTVALELAPAQPDASPTLHVDMHGPGLAVDLYLPPSRLVDWWHQVGGQYSQASQFLPPLRGTVKATELAFGDIRVEGLHLSAGPAPASSAPAPAASTGSMP